MTRHRPRDTPAHAGPRRISAASASGHRDGNPVARRAGESDQPSQADVAIRVVYDRQPCRPIFTAWKGTLELFGGIYISRDRPAALRAGVADPIRWIVISSHGIPHWARCREGEVPTMGVPLRTTDGEAQIIAVRQGVGITTLPCFVGDADPLLVRVPGTDLHMLGTLWLLTQGETRKTKRVRLFTEFVSRRLAAYAPLLAGLSSHRATDAQQVACDTRGHPQSPHGYGDLTQSLLAIVRPKRPVGYRPAPANLGPSRNRPKGPIRTSVANSSVATATMTRQNVSQ